MPLGPAEKFLLSLCFCPACCAGGETAGIRNGESGRGGPPHFEASNADATTPTESPGRAEHLATLLVMYPAFARLVRFRIDTVYAP